MKLAFEGKLQDPEMRRKLAEAKAAREAALAAQTVRWAEVYDPNAEAFYYWNPDNGEVTWEKPADFVASCDDELLTAVIKVQSTWRAKQARANVRGVRGAAAAGAGGGWTAVMDPGSGQPVKILQRTFLD